MHKLIKKFCKLGILFCFQLFVLSACTGKEDIVLELSDSETVYENEESVNPVPVSNSDSDTVNVEKIYVHICGAVAVPGVYELEAGSRVFEGIEAAGGFSEYACEDYVNQAGQLTDGERLVIPTMEEIEAAKADGTYTFGSETSGAEQSGSAGSETGLVNINTASESELGAISGIGAGKAAAIVKYRQENGSFSSVEDIMKVSGIKEGTYEKIKDKITVN
ncbi:MAG: helix-hairpin-helix domain-containing protein [Lachnospiraceae bacterium]|nr:helix-hairpin-helix domain-containing protein [Lachnospiraceae bacterium]